MKKKLLAVFLAFVLVVSMLPISVFAEEFVSENSQSNEVTEELKNTEEKNDLVEEEANEVPAVETKASEEKQEENNQLGNEPLLSTTNNVAATVAIDDEYPEEFDTVQAAWNAANDPENKDKTVVMTLYQNWVTDSNLVIGARTGLLTVNLDGNTISRNLTTAVQNGEVFTIENNVNVCIYNGTITGGNSSTNGGGIKIQGNENTKLSLNALYITGNKTEGKGGGIYIAGNPKVSIESCTINENQSGKEGKGVFVANDKNSQVSLSLSGIVKINDLILQIKNKKAPKLTVEGLGLLSSIVIGFDQNVEAVFTKAFQSSSADYIYKAFSASLESAVIKQNIDKQKETCTLLLSQKKAVAKVQKKVLGVVVKEDYYYNSIDEAFNAANQADGDITLVLLEDWAIKSHVSFYKRDLLSPLTIDLNGYKADRQLKGKRENPTGECFLVTQKGTVTIKNGTITGASHNGKGGAIYVGLAAGTLNLENLKITGNTCHQSGGGIYVANNSASVNINNCEITNNSSSRANGGGIYLASSLASVKISDSLITNNSCKYYGGGLYAEGGQNQYAGLSLSGNVQITNNTSSYSEKNLCLNYQDEKSVQIDVNALNTGSNIGIAFENGYDRIFTTAVEKNVSEYLNYFHSDLNEMTIGSVVEDNKNYLKLVFNVSYAAELVENNNVHKYTDVRKAWNDANSIYLNTTCTIILLKDWNANNGSFGDGDGFGNGRLWPKERGMENKLILDLNNHTINRGLDKFCDYGNVLSVEKTLDIEVKNGTIRGGRNSMPGGGVYMKSKGKLTLTNVTITDCKTDKKLLGGGGLFYDGDAGGECIVQGTSEKGTSITGNTVELKSAIVAWQFPYGGGVYVKGKDKGRSGYTNFRLIGKVVIKDNRANDGYDNLYIENDAGIRTPELTIGSEVWLGSSIDGHIITKMQTSYITEWETSIVKPMAQMLFLKSDRGDSMIAPHKGGTNKYNLVFRRAI